MTTIPQEQLMWTRDYSSVTPADPAAVWAHLADVESWVDWNDGVERIEVDGPVAVGTTFRMTPPGEQTLTSTIAELDKGRVLTDVTELDGIVVRVEHRLAPSGSGTTVTYRVIVSGDVPSEVLAEVGQAVSADFPQVIAALVARAEAQR